MVEPTREGCGLAESTRRPFLLGAYLAVNAIPDAALVVDGPDCAFFKAELVHGKHDLRSTLLDATGRHRILVTHVTTDDVATASGDRVRTMIRQADAMAEVGLALVTAMPMMALTGMPYEQIVGELAPALRIRLLALRGRSLEADWLGAYEDVLTVLALGMDAGGEVRADSVSIVGHLMDRNEEDQRGNVRELGRLVEAMGLRLDAVWLGGQPAAALGRAFGSATLLAFPLGRRAGAAIAARTGARVVAVDPPFGLEGTMRMLRALGAATGTERRAEAVIDAELRAVVPALEWTVPHVFLGRRVAFAGAPDLCGGFRQLAEELGMEVAALWSRDGRPAWLDDDAALGADCLFDPDLEEIRLRLEGARPVDLVVGDSDTLATTARGAAQVELGYPSYFDHAYVDRPFLGFRGYLAFLERMATALGMRALAGRR